MNITNQDLRIVYQESHSRLKNLRNKSKERKLEEGQSTIPTKITTKSVNVIQSYSFGPNPSLLVEEYGIYKELGLKQQNVTDVLSNCWLSDVHIHAAGQPIILLIGSYFLVKAQVMKDRKIFQ